MKRNCLIKLKYKSIHSVRRKILKNYFNGNNALYYYECPLCLDFHLTKKGNGFKPKRHEVYSFFKLTPSNEKIDKRMSLMLRSIKKT